MGEITTEIMEKTVPRFTFEEFSMTALPFAYAAKFKDDDVKFLQVQNIINRNAQEWGIRNFPSMLKNYMRKHHPKAKSVMMNVTEFTGQKADLVCGQYFCTDDGIYIEDSKTQTELEVCNHPVLPVQRLVNIDDNTEKLRIAYRKGVRWRELIADKETLASAGKIVSLAKYGVAVNSENAKLLVKFFTEMEGLNFDTMEELYSVSRLGWIGGQGFSPYVDKLVFDGDESFCSFFQSVKAKGSIRKWIALCGDIRKNDSIYARIMLAASFASVLVEPCGSLPFFVHLWGGTESGKTVALMLAASVWANPAMGKYIHTFNSTHVAQELAAGFVNSLPLIIDELQIIKERKDFDRIIYQLSEGVGRARGTKTGGLQRVGTWKNCILTNGEFPISTSSSGGGAVNRILEIDCKDIRLFRDPMGVVSALTKHYGCAGRAFVEYLQTEGAAELVRETQKNCCRRILKETDATEKQAVSASLLMTADELIENLFFHDGILLEIKDIQPYLSTKAQVDQNLRCLDFIYDFIAVNSNRFTVNADNCYPGEVWGETKRDGIYIIKSVFDKALKDNGYNPAAFLSWAKRKGLVMGDKTHSTVQKRLQGNRCRCVLLKNRQESGGTGEGDLPFEEA